MNGRLILVKHSLPEIRKDLPAHQWNLSEEGRLRAQRLADRLLSQHVDILASSPEPKALETAQILAANRQVDFQVVENLHEHDRNAVPHLSTLEFENAVRKFFERPDHLVFGSETANQVQERFSRAVDSILSADKNKTVTIVAHGTVISLFVSRITGQPGFQIWNELGLPGFVLLDMQTHSIITLENIL